MTERGLKALLDHNVAQAISFNDWLNVERAYNLQMYNADPDAGILKEREEGWSELVSPDTRTVIESTMPSLMRIFAAGDRVLTFAPLGKEDTDAAEQETEVLNHVIMKDNEGFRHLYDWMHDALLDDNGIAGIGWDESEWVEEENHEDLDDDAFAVLSKEIDEDEDAEIVEQTTRRETITVPLPDGMGGILESEIEITLHDVKIRRTHTEGKPRWGVIPPEEFLISPRAKSIREATFCGHRRRVPASELLEAGFDSEEVDGLHEASEYDDALNIERHLDIPLDRTETDESMREVWRNDIYIRVDGDGDGIAELRHIVYAGDSTILLNEVVESAPYYSLTPLPQPHRWQGKSLAWLVNDVQLLRSTLLRGMSNNIAMTNDPLLEIAAPGIDKDTITDALTRGPGRVLRTKIPGMIREVPTQGILPSIFQLMEQSLGDREDRTGITRYSMGTDANTLNKTATGISLIQEAANQRIELIARIFAETGIKELFLGMHDLLRQRGTKPMTVRMRGDWAEVEPSKWRRRMDMEIHVGLGIGSKDQQLLHLNNLLGMQLKAIELQRGVNGPLVNLDNVFNLLEGIVEATGRKDVERYFTRPELDEAQGAQQQEQPPNPEIVRQQMFMQMKQAEAQAGIENDRAKAATDIEIVQQKAAAHIETERMKAEAEVQRKLMLAQAEAEIRSEKARTETAAKTTLMIEEAQAKAREAESIAPI